MSAGGEHVRSLRRGRRRHRAGGEGKKGEGGDARAREADWTAEGTAGATTRSRCLMARCCHAGEPGAVSEVGCIHDPDPFPLARPRPVFRRVRRRATGRRTGARWHLVVDGRDVAWPLDRPLPADSLDTAAADALHGLQREGYYFAAVDSARVEARRPRCTSRRDRESTLVRSRSKGSRRLIPSVCATG